jgi:hypothetical protein
MTTEGAPSAADASLDRVTPTDVMPLDRAMAARGVRAAMKTLTGLASPSPARRAPSLPPVRAKRAPAPTPAAPIVVPSGPRRPAPARGTITQQPNYGAMPADELIPAIPQAPRVPKGEPEKAKPGPQRGDGARKVQASDIDELWADAPDETATQVRPYTGIKPAGAPEARPAPASATKAEPLYNRLDPRPSLVRRPPPPPQRPPSKKTDRPPSVVSVAPLQAAEPPPDAPVPPSDAALAPSDAALAPSEAALAPSEAALAPPDAVVAPSDAVLALSDAAGLPAGVGALPSNAAAPPAEAMIPSVGRAGDTQRRRRAPRGLDEQVAVPVSSMVVAGGALMALIIGAFFFGRCSNDAPTMVARRGFATLPLVVKELVPKPPKPCWVARQPVRWAPEVSKSIPFEVRPLDAMGFFVGYARDDRDAVGVEVDAKSGKFQSRFSKKTEAEIDRVTPNLLDKPVSFHVSTTKDALYSAVPIGSNGLVVGLMREGVGVVRASGQAPSAVFRFDPADASALRVLSAGSNGYAVTLRRDGAIWTGWLDASGNARGALTKVQGSGGSVGKPMTGWNGAELALVFADRPKDSDTWKIRAGHALAGAPMTTTRVFELPKGGPGGDAFAPDIVGLADGRWIVVWTEGTAGGRAIRAQTLDRDLIAVGDPIALSPPAGNFGQGVLGVAGSYATVVFLSKGTSSYELWGSILQCG